MKKTKKLFSFMLALVMVFSAMSLSLVASAIEVKFNASVDGIWADPSKGLTQSFVTDEGNANPINASLLLDFLDSILAQIKIEGDIANIIKTVNNLGISVDINSVDGILKTLDSVKAINAVPITIKIAFGYGLVTKNWKTKQSRAKTGDYEVLKNLIGFVGDNNEFIAGFVADKTKIISISTILNSDVKTFLKQTIAKLIYNYDNDPSLQAKYDAAVKKTVDNIILEDALGYGLNALLKKGDDAIKGITNEDIKEVVTDLYSWGFSLEGILDNYKYNDKLTLDATIAQIANILWGENKQYIAKLLYTYGARLQAVIVSFDYGAPFGKILKLDTFTESSDYSFLNYTSKSLKDLNGFVGQIIGNVTTYSAWSKSKNLGENLTDLFKFVIDNRDKTVPSPYDNYKFTGGTEGYALALAQMIVDAIDTIDDSVKATLKTCKTAEEVVTKLLPTLVNGKAGIVIGKSSDTWEKVLGDILGSFLADYAVLYTDTANKTRYAKGSGKAYLDVINYALNYYLVDLNLDTLLGLDLKKDEKALAKLDKIEAVIFTGASTLQYSKFSSIVPTLTKAAFDLDLKTIVKTAEDSFTNINTNVTAANLVYAMINNVLKGVVGKTVFTGNFTTIDNIVSNDSLEKATQNLVTGINTRKAQLFPVILFIFSAIDADAAFNVTVGNDGAVKVTYGGKTLVNGTDYSVSAAVNVKDKSSKLTVSGKGNYGGKVANLISNCKNHKYSAWATTKAATCKATGTQTRVCSLCKKTETKTVAKLTTHTYNNVVVKATPSKDGTITPTCKVCGAKKSATKVSRPAKVTVDKASYAYTGKEIKPAVTVTDAKGKKIASSNYTVKYTNNKNVGVATVTVTFKGNYSGTMTVTFKITPKGATLSSVTAGSKSFTAKWKKQTTQTTGYELQYSTTKNFKTGKNTKTVDISKNSTTSKQVKKLKAGTTYYVRIRTYKTVKVNGKNQKVYSSWSKAKNVKTK